MVVTVVRKVYDKLMYTLTYHSKTITLFMTVGRYYFTADKNNNLGPMVT